MALPADLLDVEDFLFPVPAAWNQRNPALPVHVIPQLVGIIRFASKDDTAGQLPEELFRRPDLSFIARTKDQVQQFSVTVGHRMELTVTSALCLSKALVFS